MTPAMAAGLYRPYLDYLGTPCSTAFDLPRWEQDNKILRRMSHPGLYWLAQSRQDN